MPAKAHNILIADQNSYWTRVLSNFLPADEYNVILAEDGLRALQIIDSQPVDLLVCELDLPEILGEQLIKMIRARKDKSELPIIIYTNKPPEEWDRECVKFTQKILLKYENDAGELAAVIGKYLKNKS